MLWKNSNKLSGQPSMLSNVFPCPFPPRVVSLGLLSALLPLSPEFTPSDVYLFQPPSYHLSAASGTLAAYWDLPGESLLTLKISLGPSSLFPSTLPSASDVPCFPCLLPPWIQRRTDPCQIVKQTPGLTVLQSLSYSLQWISFFKLNFAFIPGTQFPPRPRLPDAVFLSALPGSCLPPSS